MRHLIFRPRQVNHIEGLDPKEIKKVTVVYIDGTQSGPLRCLFCGCFPEDLHELQNHQCTKRLVRLS